ncbi:putative inorganic phosphate cotransporter isoform X2 [Periplaneta americana]|uniref:putative inorganic phosphate cotransporter isoform X2 n=1 Tax=Periplaneta americana TaxID=6978 RepID=UPI0037E82241
MAGCMSTRDILWYLVFTGFAVNYMVRLNINIGIVSMVKNIPKSNNISYSNTCVQTVISNSSANSTAPTISITDEPKFDWDAKQQGLVLGGYFWLHPFFQVAGGVMAQRYGTKLVFGVSNVMQCLLSFLIPLLAELDYRALIFLRVIQGIIGGVTWPSMHNLTASWIPPNERSKFLSAYMGSSIGAALTYPLCGLLISWFGWPSVFYVTGGIGVVWFIAWWVFVYDSPAQHPRISEKEKKYILDCLGKTVTTKKPPIPWKRLLLSRPMWMNVMAQWGNLWGLFTLMTQAPTYFRFIHGWDIRMTGLFSGIPHLCRTTFAIIMSTFGDYLLRNNLMARTNVRKMATAFCCIGQGLFVLGLALSGCNSTAAIVCLAAATGVSGAVSTGALAGFVDISPNFASVMLGISFTVTVIPGFLSPALVGFLTHQNQTVGQWQIVFLIVSFMLVVTGVLYQFFATAELQEWNSPADEKNNHELGKLEPLLTTKSIDSIIKEDQNSLEHDIKHNKILIN